MPITPAFALFVACHGPVSAADAPTAPETGGANRVAVAAAGAAGILAGSAWYLVVGDTYGAGDPASLMIGAGLVGMSGATLGALAAHTRGEAPLDEDVRAPPLSLGLGYGGTAWAGERRAHTGRAQLAPWFALSDATTLRLAASYDADVGSTRDIDPRPQASGGQVLEEQGRGYDVAPELRVAVSERVDVAVMSALEVRDDSFEYAGGTGSELRRVAALPVVPGTWVRLSPTQRIGAYLGPRWDWAAVEDGPATKPWFGPFFGAFHYDIQLHHSAVAASRLRVSYLHSNLSGVGFNAGAMIGLAGPFHVDWALRLPGAETRRWDLQVGTNVAIGDGGGAALSVGAAPRRRRDK